MWISRNYKAHQWEALKLITEADWQTGVDIFEDRMESRYLVHTRRILDHKTSGFAALTLDCAVIETMEQFRRGKKKTKGGSGEKYFVSFLRGTSFSGFVNEKQASVFYTNIRCGLLHQGEAPASLVKRSSKLPLIAFTEDQKGVIVNAKAFHDQLEKTIHEYAAMLRKPESTKERAAFKKKMNYICQVEDKPQEGIPA
jgi:hypothetical protein